MSPLTEEIVRTQVADRLHEAALARRALLASAAVRANQQDSAGLRARRLWMSMRESSIAPVAGRTRWSPR